MSTLDPTFDAELAKDAVTLFVAVEIVLPSGPVRLLDGSDEVTFSGKTFVGQDDTFGVLLAIDTISDGTDAQAPRLALSIVPPDASSAAVLCGPTVQGSEVNVWAGAVNPLTGAVVGTPDLWFAGEVDVPTLRPNSTGRIVDLEAASIFERFFDQDDGAKLSNAFQQTIWPGDMGLEFVTDVQRQMPWGSDAPRPANVRDVTQTPAQTALQQIASTLFR